MKDMIIDEIVRSTEKRIQREKQLVPLEEVKEQAYKLPKSHFRLYNTLKEPALSYICEVKKASPSKGVIAQDFDYLKIAKEYEDIGAHAISVLTEPDYFQGHLSYLKEISEEVSIPTLRKDFIIDEYMIYQAKIAKASAVLLISGILTLEQLKHYLSICHELGLDALVEARDEEQLQKAIKAKARIIGVNNRDLRDFSVDIHHSLRFLNMIPEDVLFVSESGIQERSQIMELEEHHVNGVLIGETLMRARDKGAMLKRLKGEN